MNIKQYLKPPPTYVMVLYIIEYDIYIYTYTYIVASLCFWFSFLGLDIIFVYVRIRCEHFVKVNCLMFFVCHAFVGVRTLFT